MRELQSPRGRRHNLDGAIQGRNQLNRLRDAHPNIMVVFRVAVGSRPEKVTLYLAADAVGRLRSLAQAWISILSIHKGLFETL